MSEGRPPVHIRPRGPLLRNGAGPRGTVIKPLDRSYLLRRSPRIAFEPAPDPGCLRIRRERRVCGAFSGIPGLARDGRAAHSPFRSPF